MLLIQDNFDFLKIYAIPEKKYIVLLTCLLYYHDIMPSYQNFELNFLYPFLREASIVGLNNNLVMLSYKYCVRVKARVSSRPHTVCQEICWCQ